jgi:hypothetical protein
MIVGIIGIFLSWLGLIGFGMWLAREESKK